MSKEMNNQAGEATRVGELLDGARKVLKRIFFCVPFGHNWRCVQRRETSEGLVSDYVCMDCDATGSVTYR